jgi:hypothetical protein
MVKDFRHIGYCIHRHIRTIHLFRLKQKRIHSTCIGRGTYVTYTRRE